MRSINFTGSPTINAEDIARIAAQAAADKKAEDIVILDLRTISSFTDFFLICSGASEPQLRAIASSIEDRLRQDHASRPAHVEGYPLSQWVVMDYTDVVIHIFHQDIREFYALEELWGDAPRLELEEAPESAKS